MSNLRIRYAFISPLLLISTSVSAISTEQLKRHGDEENSSSLEHAVEGKLPNDGESDDDDDSRNRPPISYTTTTTTTALADTNPTPTSTSRTSALIETIPIASSSPRRSAAIAASTVGSLIILAIIGFLLFRWRRNKKFNNGPWAEKYPQSMGPVYQQAPPSTLFGGSSQFADLPAMPKPPSLVLVNDRQLFRDPEDRPTNNYTFYRESHSSHSSSLPPVFEELKSPGVESSISQSVPYPERSATRKMDAPFVPPPTPDARDTMVSSFSWTTKRSSADSAPKFRSIHSWVNHQAGRTSVKETLAQMGLDEGASLMPVTLNFHPGAPVPFGVGHGSMRSEDLDR